MYAGEADALVQKANLTGCARMDTVRIMQKGRLNFLYPMNTAWRMQDADPGRSRRLAVSGPAQGRVLWSRDIGKSAGEPVVLVDGTICIPCALPSGHDGLMLLDADGTTLREIETGWLPPLVSASETLFVVINGAICEFTPGGELVRRGLLGGSSVRITGTPDGGFCRHCTGTGFTVNDADGRLRWCSVKPPESAWREGIYAFDSGRILYTAEHDTWRSDGDDAEYYSRIGAYDAQGRLLWRHVFTAPNAYNHPLNTVESIWAREDDAVFFGHPLIQCYGRGGEERWRINQYKDLGEQAALPRTSLCLARDIRLNNAPWAVVFDGHRSGECIACARDASNGAYFCHRGQVYAINADCSLRWQLSLDADYLQPPVLSPRDYVLVCGGSRLYAIG